MDDGGREDGERIADLEDQLSDMTTERDELLKERGGLLEDLDQVRTTLLRTEDALWSLRKRVGSLVP